MSTPAEHAIAIVGVGAILPDAPDAGTFWDNVTGSRYSISEVDPSRWDPDLYYDADPHAPERTYSKIGGWVRDWQWDPLGWHLPIPPTVSAAMDDAQKWGVACTRMVLADYGWPERPLDLERTAVVLGQRDGRRAALPDLDAPVLPRPRPPARGRAELRLPAAGRAGGHLLRAARGP